MALQNVLYSGDDSYLKLFVVVVRDYHRGCVLVGLFKSWLRQKQYAQGPL